MNRLLLISRQGCAELAEALSPGVTTVQLSLGPELPSALASAWSTGAGGKPKPWSALVVAGPDDDEATALHDTFRTLKELYRPFMRQRAGCILVAGYTPVDERGHGIVAGIRAMCQIAALELAPKGVIVNHLSLPTSSLASLVAWLEWVVANPSHYVTAQVLELVAIAGERHE